MARKRKRRSTTQPKLPEELIGGPLIPPIIWKPASPHERRMDEFSKFVPPPEWQLPGSARARLERAMEMDVGFQIKFKRLQKLIPYFIATRFWGGSGLVMARTLRRYFLEYANRLVQHGPHSLPSSFNIVEAFLVHSVEVALFDLRPEIDHLFSADDYFDWYKHSGMPHDPVLLRDVMQESTIYSFNMVSQNGGLRVAGDESTLVIAGVSLVRHENELSCMLVAGEYPPYPSDEEVAQIEATSIANSERAATCRRSRT